MFIKKSCWGFIFVGLLSNAFADTTEVKTQTIVEVKKSGGHCEQDPNCFNRYHPAIKPVARAKPGDLIMVHTRDALDALSLIHI
jgi:formamidase